MTSISFIEVLAMTSIVAGCASTEINFNTLDIASTYDSLITKQVAFNLLKTLADPDGIPSYVKIATQTTQTLDAINPTVSLPLSVQRTLTETATSVLSGKSLQTAGEGLSVQLQTNRQSNYTLSPVIDPDELRRIRSIYQYVTGYISDFDFEVSYPIIETSPSSIPAQPPSSGNVLVSGKIDGIDVTFTIAQPKIRKPEPQIYVRRTCLDPDPLTGVCHRYGFVSVHPDTTFISLPGCIMCDLGIFRNMNQNIHLLQKNPRLIGELCADKTAIQAESPCPEQYVTRDLLFYRPGEPIDTNAVFVASSGFKKLYVKGSNGLQAFYELALFTQEASSQGTGSPSSGGQSEGRKTEPLQRISAPGLSLIQ
jgi:hypothetical protein